MQEPGVLVTACGFTHCQWDERREGESGDGLWGMGVWIWNLQVIDESNRKLTKGVITAFDLEKGENTLCQLCKEVRKAGVCRGGRLGRGAQVRIVTAFLTSLSNKGGITFLSDEKTLLH